MNRTARKVAERLRKRNSFDDLLNFYERDRGTVTLPARMAISALASFEHADVVTAELNVQHARRVAAAQATQAPKGPPPGMPGDAARVLYPPPHHGGAGGGGGGGPPPPGGGQSDYPMAPPGQPDYLETQNECLQKTKVFVGGMLAFAKASAERCEPCAVHAQAA